MLPAARRPIRVAILNDYPLVVAGLAAMLTPFERRVTLVELTVRTGTISEPVDVVLYDMFATDRRTVTIPRALKPKPRGMKVILFGWSTDVALIENGMQHGVDGYIHKSLPAMLIVEGIERVTRGEKVVIFGEGHPDAPRRKAGEWPGKSEGLTSRESEVLALITQGLPNEDIAKSLFLSPNSIKSIIRTAYKKMGVTRRAQAVAWGATHGFRTGPQQNYRIVYPDKSEGRFP